MTDKSLGQVAFWRFHYERGDITVEQVEALWRGIPQSERDCWQAAAEAVVARLWGSAMTLRRPEGQDAYDWWAKMTLDDIKRVRAIIEAAVEARDDYEYLLKQAEKIGAEYPRLHALIESVQAYEKEQG